jgi:protein-S-isoprenylcysteine O-methyltransferase Ste14
MFRVDSIYSVMELPNLSFSPWVIPAAAGVYGLIHSLMASLPFKYWLYALAGKAAERYYRLFYSLFAVLTLLPVLALTALIPDVRLYSIPAPYVYLTSALQVLAVLLLIYSLLQTGAFQFIGLAQALGIKTSESLNTKGLYRYIRHPLYAFSLVFLWLTPVMTRNIVLLYGAFTFYIILGALYEERKLQLLFGAAYRDYRARTAFLIPFLF